MSVKTVNMKKIMIILAIILVLVLSAFYFYPRLQVLQMLIKARNEEGFVGKVDFGEPTEYDYEILELDFVIVRVPALSDDEEYEVEYSDELNNYVIVKDGFSIILSNNPYMMINEYYDSNNYFRKEFGVESTNELTIFLYKENSALPTIFQSLDSLEKESDFYLRRIVGFGQQAYGVYENEVYSFPISNFKHNMSNIYRVDITDCANNYDNLIYIIVKEDPDENGDISFGNGELLYFLDSIRIKDE